MQGSDPQTAPSSDTSRKSRLSAVLPTDRDPLLGFGNLLE